MSFGVFNSFSFLLLTGNIISLYLLRLGASATQIGIVAAFPFISFFFMIPGRSLVRFTGVVRLFGLAWLLRYLAIAPILFAPVIFARHGQYAAFTLVAATTLGFNAARGMGIVANAPMFGGFSTERDRGAFLSAFQIMAGVIAIGTGLATAFFLGPEAPLSRYSVFLAAGISSGFVATALAYFIPELPDEGDQTRTPFFPQIGAALKERGFRRFFFAFVLVATCSGVGRSFFVVFAKLAYDHSDQAAMVYTAVGSVGNILAGTLGALLLDRLGAKPMLQFGLVAFGIAAALASWVPGGSTLLVSALVTGAVFLLGMLGVAGSENASQAYFYGITPDENRLNLGILYFLILGVGGTIGSLLGGVLLDALRDIGFGTTMQFRALFGGTLVLTVIALIFVSRLEPLGAHSFSGTLSVMFSLRDLRAAGILNRLSRAQSAVQERDTLRELAGSESDLPVAEVLERVHAPSYIVRTEAIETLSTLPFTPEVESALISHLKEYEYTTAATAARRLGVQKSVAAIPALREAARSGDYWLQAKAIVALARLGDTESFPFITGVLRDSDNPTVLIHTGAAVRIAEIDDAIPVVLARLARADQPSYVLDELIASLVPAAAIGEWFYPAYVEYLREGKAAAILLTRELPLVQADRILRKAAQKLDGEASETYRLLEEYAVTHKERAGRMERDFPFTGALPDKRVGFFLVAAAGSAG